jgi:hypothetical protein
MNVLPSRGEITRVTWLKLGMKDRVTPVTIASAWPFRTMQAQKTLRSRLTMRWQSRRKRALALQLVIEEIDIVLVMVRHLGVGDRQVLGTFKAEPLNGLANPMLAPDQDRIAIAGIAEGQRGADHLLLLALGKDNPLAVGADALENHLQCRGL